MVRVLIMAGLVDAFAVISLVFGLILFFSNGPFLQAVLDAAKTTAA
jgi:F-type H+-transporting ATPase subunit c